MAAIIANRRLLENNPSLAVTYADAKNSNQDLVKKKTIDVSTYIYIYICMCVCVMMICCGFISVYIIMYIYNVVTSKRKHVSQIMVFNKRTDLQFTRGFELHPISYR